MDTPELVTNVLLYQENLPSADTGDFVAARKRVKRNAQRATNRTWQHRPWPWSFIRADVSVASGVGSLPATFLNFSRFGGVFPDANKPPMAWCPFSRFNEAKYRMPNTGSPRIYTVGEQDPATGTKKLLVWPTLADTVHVVFKRTSPHLFDNTAGLGDTDPSPDELYLIPADYHETVIYEWTVYFQMKDKANQQSVSEQLRIASDGLKAMVENERTGIEAPHNVVPYGTGRR